LRDHEALNISPKLIEEVAERAEIDLTDRPERLSPEAFLRLAGTLP